MTSKKSAELGLPSINWDDVSDVTEVKEKVSTKDDDVYEGEVIDAAHIDLKTFELPTLPRDGEPKPLAFAESAVNEVTTAELQGEPTPEQIAAAEALLARVKRSIPVRDPDAPVSDKPIPIKMIEPDNPVLSMIDRGGIQIIATKDRIELINRLDAGEQAPQPAQRHEQPLRITNKTMAEQEMGRRALGSHTERAQLFPRLPKTAREIARDAPPVEIIRSGQPLQHLLMRTPNKDGVVGA